MPLDVKGTMTHDVMVTVLLFLWLRRLSSRPLIVGSMV